MQLSFEQAMQLIELLIIGIGMILLHRSVPSGALKKLLDTLEKTAATTPTQIDDQAVSAAKLFATLLTGQPTTAPTPAPVPVVAAAETDSGLLTTTTATAHTHRIPPHPPSDDPLSSAG